MDKDLTEFFGRAKRISLLPQERKEIGQKLFAERKQVLERHNKCMKLPADLMDTAGAIGLNAQEKKRSRKELQAFMRRNPPQKETPSAEWSPQAFIAMYVPIMAVTLIILANAQQLNGGVPSRSEPKQYVPAPLQKRVPRTDDEGGRVPDEDQNSAVTAPQPSIDVVETLPPPSESPPEQLQEEPAGITEPVSPRQEVEKSNEEGKTEMQRGVTPEVQSLEVAPDTMQIRSFKNEQSTESLDATTESLAAPSTALTQIIAAEARLESLRNSLEESEEATALFKQAEQLLQKARTFAEKNTERALQYLQEAESLMDKLT